MGDYSSIDQQEIAMVLFIMMNIIDRVGGVDYSAFLFENLTIPIRHAGWVIPSSLFRVRNGAAIGSLK